MSIKNTIDFFCWEKDGPIEVQLEPEALTFTVFPGSNLRFVAICGNSDFRWSLRITPEDKGVQIFPDTTGSYEIEVYQNGEFIKDWYLFIESQQHR